MENETLKSALESKSRRRHALARLPIEEKLRAVAELQRLAAPVLQRRGTARRVWPVPEPATNSTASPRT